MLSHTETREADRSWRCLLAGLPPLSSAETPRTLCVGCLHAQPSQFPAVVLHRILSTASFPVPIIRPNSVEEIGGAWSKTLGATTRDRRGPGVLARGGPRGRCEGRAPDALSAPRGADSSGRAAAPLRDPPVLLPRELLAARGGAGFPLPDKAGPGLPTTPGPEDEARAGGRDSPAGHRRWGPRPQAGPGAAGRWCPSADPGGGAGIRREARGRGAGAGRRLPRRRHRLGPGLPWTWDAGDRGAGGGGSGRGLVTGRGDALAAPPAAERGRRAGGDSRGCGLGPPGRQEGYVG